MISENIQDLITMAESMPKSERRNRMMSRLKDARDIAIVMEKGDLSFEEGREYNLSEVMDKAGWGCICPPGAIDNTCPVHGKKPV